MMIDLTKKRFMSWINIIYQYCPPKLNNFNAVRVTANRWIKSTIVKSLRISASELKLNLKTLSPDWIWNTIEIEITLTCWKQ